MKSVLGIVTSLLLFLVALPASGQVALKTNLLYDATMTVNLGAEVALAPKWSVDLSGNLNAWTLDNGRRWKHWLIQPEARYWFCDRFAGHFVGAHLLGGQYNLGNWKHGFNFLGIAYGYTWILAKHWSFEAEIGLGWAYTRYDVYPCAHCGNKLENRRVHNYVGPTKAALNIIYAF